MTGLRIVRAGANRLAALNEALRNGTTAKRDWLSKRKGDWSGGFGHTLYYGIMRRNIVPKINALHPDAIFLTCTRHWNVVDVAGLMARLTS